MLKPFGNKKKSDGDNPENAVNEETSFTTGNDLPPLSTSDISHVQPIEYVPPTPIATQPVVSQPASLIPPFEPPQSVDTVTPIAPMPPAIHPIEPQMQAPAPGPAPASQADSQMPPQVAPQADSQMPPQVAPPVQPGAPGPSTQPAPDAQQPEQAAAQPPELMQYPDEVQFSEEQMRAIEMAKSSTPLGSGALLNPDSDAGFEHLKPPRKSPVKVILITLLIIIFAGAAGFGSWYYWSTQLATFDYELQPVVILSGQSVVADDFLPDNEIERGVTATFINESFAPVPGRIIVPLTLKHGLRSLETDATLYVLTPETQKTHEFRTEAPEMSPVDFLTNAGLARGVPYDVKFTTPPLLPEEYEVGEHTLTLTLNGAPFEVLLTIVDTTPPIAVPVDVEKNIGEDVTADEFVTDIFDHSEIEAVNFIGTHTGETSIAAFTTQDIDVEVVDIHGNSETFRSSLLVRRNETPPVLTNVPAIVESMVGTEIVYPSDVIAFDDFGREIEYTIDDTDVDTDTIGKYTATYIAEDFSGLKDEIEITVYIIEIDPDEVDAWINEKLGEIIKDDMSGEEITRAILEQVRKTITPATNLKDEWDGSLYTAAHYAINNTSGNYYHYYALSELMLTRAGIENMRIERSEESKMNTPHFWNLVCINDVWYHYDSMYITNWNAYNWMNGIMHMFTQAQAEEMAKQLVTLPSVRKEGYYDFDKSLYPDIAPGE